MRADQDPEHDLYTAIQMTPDGLESLHALFSFFSRSFFSSREQMQNVREPPTTVSPGSNWRSAAFPVLGLLSSFAHATTRCLKR